MHSYIEQQELRLLQMALPHRTRSGKSILQDEWSFTYYEKDRNLPKDASPKKHVVTLPVGTEIEYLSVGGKKTAMLYGVTLKLFGEDRTFYHDMSVCFTNPDGVRLYNRVDQRRRAVAQPSSTMLMRT